jgi:protocatechuate 3,4-dioxygenase beta subunit
MKGAILVLLISGCLRAQQGSLEGTAVHAVTREPLSNVHVRLIAATFGGITGAYGAMSDRTGHFSIATIRPGTYILLPERAGFLHVQPKGSTSIPTLTIKPGEALTGYQLEMAPRAAISGRVVDEAGDPVQGVRVQTVPVTAGSVPVMLTPAPNPATDDRGEFRLIGPAGKYYVQATVNTGGGLADRPEKRNDGTSEAIYGTTFYPSSVRKDRGTVVEAVAGKDASGIEIRLARQQQGLAIGGVVSGFPEGPWRGYVVMQFGDSAQRITGSRNTMVGAEGKFRFDGLQPGYYRVWAMYNDGGKTQLASRMMEFSLENTEIANVELAVSPGVELTGTLKMEGEAVEAAPKRTVKLEPALGYFLVNLTTTGGEVDRDGAFRIGNIAPGKYPVKVEPLAENAYIKTLEIDGVAVTNGMADLSRVARGASAKVVLGRNGAQISGRVLDPNGERLPTSLVMIFLVRDPDDIPLTGAGTAQATPDGKYTIKGVVPGKYRLFGLDILQTSGAISSGDTADMLKKLFERGEEIEFKEGDRIAKDLKVIPVEDPNAKPKK